jgi:hypothetical protein
MQMVQEPEVLRGYESARRKVAETLANLNFARVVSVIQNTSRSNRGDFMFQGEVEEVFCGKHGRHASRHAYFSKFTRNESGVSVLGCFNLADTPMGAAHLSSVPQIGDVLVGSFVSAATKGKLPYEFKGWCNNGKPLLELMRILQFGSRMSKGELHTLLRQPASVTASFALRLQKATLSSSSRVNAERASEAQDDIWLIARALCFRELDIDTKLKLSKPHFEILNQLAMTTLDEEMLEDLQKLSPPEPPAQEFHIPSSYYTGFSAGAGYGAEFQGLPDGAKTPPYSSSPVFPPKKHTSLYDDEDNQMSKTPEYMPSSPKPSSPAYRPSSPPYRPASPIYKPASPSYKPASPTFTPASPTYKPASPTYKDTPSYKPASPTFSPQSPSKSPKSLAFGISSSLKEEGEVMMDQGNMMRDQGNMMRQEEKTEKTPSLLTKLLSTINLPRVHSSHPVSPAPLRSPSTKDLVDYKDI